MFLLAGVIFALSTYFISHCYQQRELETHTNWKCNCEHILFCLEKWQWLWLVCSLINPKVGSLFPALPRAYCPHPWARRFPALALCACWRCVNGTFCQCECEMTETNEPMAPIWRGMFTCMLYVFITMQCNHQIKADRHGSLTVLSSNEPQMQMFQAFTKPEESIICAFKWCFDAD